MLESLKIIGFRSCGDVEIHLDTGLTALIGPNGVGKSNLLRAIERFAECVTVADAFAAEEDLPPQDPLQYRAELRLDGKRISYDLEYRGSDSKPSGPLREECHVDGAVLFRRDGDELSFGADGQQMQLRSDAPAIPSLLSLLPEKHAAAPVVQQIAAFLRSTKYYPLNARLGTSPTITGKHFIQWQREYASSGLPPESIGLRLLHMWSEERSRFDELLSLVGPEGLGLLDEIKVHKVGLDDRADPNDDSVFWFIHFVPSSEMGGSGKPFTFQSLSAGTQRVLQILVSLLFDRRALMLIEEPEDSVHPGLLRRLIAVMRSYCGSSQVVFSTHSPETLNMLQPQEIRLVSASGGKTALRPLSGDETRQAAEFLRSEGTLSDFLEPLQESGA